MSIEHHDLHHEFPEYNQQIHDLKVGDRHFARLFEEYHDLDRDIRKFEEEVEVTSDAHLEELKLKRVHLKDELYQILKDHAA